MKLLIVDPHFSRTSPSMKGILLALPELKAQGWHIELWCWHVDEGAPVDKVVKLPRFGKVHTLDNHAFSAWARLRAWWKFKVKKEPKPDLIYTMAWYLPACDVCHVQFSPFDWEQRQRALGIKSFRDAFERGANFMSLIVAARFLSKTTARRVICASDAVAKDVRQQNPRLHTTTLANCYDAKRFHPAVRGIYREPLRAQLGLSLQDYVFVFVSAGHYRRKGFFLALDAIAKVRMRPGNQASAKLLVLGGTEARLHALQQQMDKRHPDWKSFVTFTGMVPDVEKYLAAADGFLFPSYSEAFALVEVEAAACGLPLFLTAHHGSEMILEDGRNGRLLEFDSEHIAGVIGEYVDGKWEPEHGVHLKHALDDREFARRFARQLAEVVEEMKPKASQPSGGSRVPASVAAEV